MRILTIIFIGFVLVSCGNKKQNAPVAQPQKEVKHTYPSSYTTPRNLFPENSPKQKNPFLQNKTRENNNSSDNRYYCENCGEVIYDISESEEYCEDCLEEQQEQEERTEEGGDDYEE
jgi:hypothetical protein